MLMNVTTPIAMSVSTVILDVHVDWHHRQWGGLESNMSAAFKTGIVVMTALQPSQTSVLLVSVSEMPGTSWKPTSQHAYVVASAAVVLVCAYSSS